MNPVIEALLAALLLVASFFTLVGSLGLVKLSEFFRRLHGPTKSTTMGVGCVLIVSIFYHAMVGNSFHPRELLISVFLFITALASLITLTPGTVSAELSDDRRYLLIHALDLQDPEALIDEIKSRYEAPLKEIFP